MSEGAASPSKPEGGGGEEGGDESIYMTPQQAQAIALRRRKKQEELEAELIGDGGDENVNVCIRVRPFNRRELEIQANSDDVYALRSVVEMPDGMSGRVNMMEKTEEGDYKLVEEFKYTKSFWSVLPDQQPHPFDPITQEDVYEHVGKPILKYAFAGFNNCVFAYGQTGSGKTHSMMGDFTLDNDSMFGDLIPRLCRELFEKLEEKQNEKEEGIVKSYNVKLNAIEIYNEQVKDLFWRSTPGRAKTTVLKVRTHPTDGAFVDQLTMLEPVNWRDCLKKIEKGVAERTVAATLMNDESSRSHSVFQIILTQTETVHIRSDDPDDRYSKPITYKKISKINLVDLAGSERLKKSGAQGQQLKEAAGINLSLTTLKKVIDALVVNSKETNKKKQILIPFRESTLTLLLSDSLGGNSKTTMIACVSPHYDNQEETLLTLRYANRTGAVVNHTRINEDTAAKQALALKHQLLELQKRLAEGPVDEEAEELLDQIDLGRQTLKEVEEKSRQADKAAEEMKSKTKAEEGLRFTTAFYNTLRVALMVQHKDQVDRQVRELTDNLNNTKGTASTLREEVKAHAISDLQVSKKIEKMQFDDRMKEDHDNAMASRATKLRNEQEELKRRYDRELELRYAQKLANARKARSLRIEVDQELNQLQKENDDKLSKVIMSAAEEYELQVREFADQETNQQHKITGLEKEIKDMARQRERYENEASVLMTQLRTSEKEHRNKMTTIETDWKSKYEGMKEDYQKQISNLEQELFEQSRKEDVDVDEEALKENDAYRATVAQLERDLLQKESEWKMQVSKAFETHGDRIHDAVKQAEADSRLKAITTRRDFERRISELYGRLERIKYMETSHEKCMNQLETILRTLAKTHDRLVEPPPPESSQELIELKSQLKRFDGEIESSPLARRNREAQLEAATATPSKSGGAGPDGTSIASGTNGSFSRRHQSSTLGGTPLKGFSVFSQERFDAVNTRSFEGPCPRAAANLFGGNSVSRSPNSQRLPQKMSLSEMFESRHSDPNATVMGTGGGSFEVGGSPGVARRLDSYPRNTPPVTMTPQGRPISRISLPADNTPRSMGGKASQFKSVSVKR